MNVKRNSLATALNKGIFVENFRRLLKAALCLATAFASYSISAANLPEVDRGITWLSSQVTAGGTLQSESASIATPVQARAEAFLTLKALASPTTVLADTVVADTDANTEYLSRKVLVQAAAARNTSTLIAQVRALQNTDGGFGVYSGFTSNALDTAWALQALKAANAIPTDAAGGKRCTGRVLAYDGSGSSAVAQRIHRHLY